MNDPPFSAHSADEIVSVYPQDIEVAYLHDQKMIEARLKVDFSAGDFSTQAKVVF